jgi:hypothetical protein
VFIRKNGGKERIRINRHILQQKDDDNFSLKSYLGWHHQFNKHHTVRWQNTFNYTYYLPDENWQSNQLVFNSLLPLQNDILYTVRQNTDKKTENGIPN